MRPTAPGARVKIVYCHNYYRSRGGEDVSFECDVELLRQRGHEVFPFTRDNHSLNSGGLRTAVSAIWNRDAEREIAEVLRRERPDVLHCNNLFPQLTVSFYRPAARMHIPVVQALRNYRAFCANSFFYESGKVCTRCLGRTAAWHGLVRRCYRDSFAATGAVVAMQLVHRMLRIQHRYVDAFFTPSQFARQIHIDGGFPADRMHCRPNYILPDLGFRAEKADEAIFVGRLSPEKGVDTLLDAWQMSGVPLRLKIVGTGPEEQRLRDRAAALPGVEFLGGLRSSEVLEHIARARVLFITSRWYETFGRTIAEAFSRGTPVIASKLGAMSELVTDGVDGFHFETASPESLAATIRRMFELGPEEFAAMCRAARSSYDRKLSAEVSYQALMRIYQAAAAHASQRLQPIFSAKKSTVRPGEVNG